MEWKNRLSIGILSAVLLLQACNSSAPSSASRTSTNGQSTGQARFTFNCNLNGSNAKLLIDVEAINTTGQVFGSGPNPDLSVIGTGSFIYFTSGTLTSATAYYLFSGENNFADFTDQNSLAQFRVEWVLTNDGLTLIANPFSQQPTQYACRLESSMYL